MEIMPVKRSSDTSLSLYTPSPDGNPSFCLQPDGDVTAAIASFDLSTIEPGFHKSIKSEHRSSILYSWGIRAERTVRSTNDAYQALFYCLGSEECRRAGNVIRMKRTDNTCQATNHLRICHGAFAGKKRRQSSEKRQKLGNPQNLMNAPKTYDPVRSRCLHSVLVYIVSKFQPFDHFEDSVIHRFCSKEMPTLAVNALNCSVVLKLIVELYSFKTRRVIELINKSKNSSLPPFHFSVGTWKNDVCEEDYLGIRLWWIDETWKIQSEILAIRHFRPNPNVSKSSVLLSIHAWVWQVLNEFGLSREDIFSSNLNSITDSIENTLTSKWDVCIPHMMNAIILEGLGSSNPSAEHLIKQIEVAVTSLQLGNLVDCNGKFIQLLEGTSDVFVDGHLYQHEANRWIGLTACIENLLRVWDTFESFFVEAFQLPYPLTGRLIEIQELYSILKPMTSIIEICQSATSHTASNGLLMLIKLRSSTLRSDTELEVICSGRFKNTKAFRKHEDLTNVAQLTRYIFAKALDEQFFNHRYARDIAEQIPFIFDMASALSPLHSRLPYLKKIDSLIPSCFGKSEDNYMRIFNEIQGLVEKVVIFDQSRENANAIKNEADSMKSDAEESEFGMNTLSNTSIDASMLELLGIEVVNDCSTMASSKALSTHLMGPMAIAKQAIEAYQGLDLGGWRDRLMREQGQWNGNIVLEWWNEVGSKFPGLQPLAKVARSVLGAPASGGIVERGFSSPSRFMTGGRPSLVPYVEMAMFLNASKIDIDLLNEVDSILPDDVIKHVPKRWKEDGSLISNLESNSAFDGKEGLRWDNWYSYSDILKAAFPKPSFSI